MTTIPTQKDPIKAGQDLYFEPKPEGDRDLVKEVRDIFQQAGISDQALSETYDANRHIVSAHGKTSLVQRFKINSFTEIALAMSAEDTISIREEILPAGPMDHWVDQYRTKIAPFLAKKKILG